MKYYKRFLQIHGNNEMFTSHNLLHIVMQQHYSPCPEYVLAVCVQDSDSIEKIRPPYSFSYKSTECKPIV